MLGSGTLEPDSARTSPAHYVEGPGFRALLDCGAETAASLARLDLPWTSLTHLLLTHFHTDHVGGLPPLFWALAHGVGPSGVTDRSERLTVLGPPGVIDLFDRLAAAFGSFMAKPGRALDVVELERSDQWADPEGGFELKVYPAFHTEGSVSYRLTCGGGVMGYTGDTGPCDGVVACLGDTDVGISECARPDSADDPEHLSPSSIAALLAGREPGLLITTHAYAPLDPDRVPDLIRARGYTGRVLAGYDGMDVRISKGQVDVGSTGNQPQ